MDVLLQAWDRVELWFVTLPFALQLVSVLALATPCFVVVAIAVERIADLAVAVSRGLVGRQPVATYEKEVG